MEARNTAAMLVLGGLVLGGALALATPTRMVNAPEPQWRKGSALAQQADLAPAPFSAQTYPVDSYPIQAEPLYSPLAHAAVFARDTVRASEALADDVAALQDDPAIGDPPPPPEEADDADIGPPADAQVDEPEEAMPDDPAQSG